MSALQDATRAAVGELLTARERLDDDAYRALLDTVQAWLVREFERLALGEAARAKRTERESRAELLERHGRAYGGLRLAVAFTAGLEGDAAKRVTSRGWDKTRPLADPDQGAALLRHRGEHRNPAIVLRPSGLVGIDVDGPEGLELLRRIVPEGLPRTAAVETGKQAGYHLHYLAPEGSRSAFVELGPEGVTVKGEPVPRRAAERSPLGPCLSVRRRPRAVGLELATLPLALLVRLERAAHSEREQRAVTVGPITAGGRHDHLMRLGCAIRRRGAGEATIAAALLGEGATAAPHRRTRRSCRSSPPTSQNRYRPAWHRD